MILTNKKILLTGGTGFLGNHVYEALLKKGISKNNILISTSNKTDLKIWENCLKVTGEIDIVLHLAAKIGGIGFNKEKPGEIFYDNALMGIQLMEAARLNGVKKFVTIGTVCAYPKIAAIPFKEADLWEGYPEEVTAPYGLAKKMMLVQGKAYLEQYGFKSIFLMPVNLYGPGDHFESEYSHVMPALIKRIVDAKDNNLPVIDVWGSGKATREFLFAADAAEGILLATENYDSVEPVNLGSSKEISIKNLVKTISDVVGYTGRIRWDETKPDGAMRRKVDISKANAEFGFMAKTSLKKGIRTTVEWYINTNKK